MEATLTIKQRLSLIALLQPMSSSAAKRQILNDMINALSLSENEIKDSGYSETILPAGGMTFIYHPAQDPMKKISFGEVVVELLSKKLSKLDKDEKIDGDLFPLYKIFVNETNLVPFKTNQ